MAREQASPTATATDRAAVDAGAANGWPLPASVPQATMVPSACRASERVAAAMATTRVRPAGKLVRGAVAGLVAPGAHGAVGAERQGEPHPGGDRDDIAEAVRDDGLAVAVGSPRR